MKHWLRILGSTAAGLLLAVGTTITVASPRPVEPSGSETTATHMAENSATFVSASQGTIQPGQTPGRRFFDEHLAYIFADDIDGMIDDQYTQDAVLISPFDIIPGTPPPHIVRGNRALKDFFHAYTDWQGFIDVEDVYDFAETENSISFQAIFTSQTGRWVVGDAWHMTGGKIDTHYSFAHRLGDPTPTS